MPSIESAQMKAEFAKSISDEVASTITNSEKNVIGLTAARDVVTQILSRFKEYEKNIEAALKSGDFPPEAKDAVDTVHTDLTTLVDNAQREIAKAADAQLFFTRGMQRAVAMMEAKVKAEKEAAESERTAAEALASLAPPPHIEDYTPPGATEEAVARIETEAAAALLASLPPEKPKRKRSK